MTDVKKQPLRSQIPLNALSPALLCIIGGNVQGQVKWPYDVAHEPARNDSTYPPSPTSKKPEASANKPVSVSPLSKKEALSLIRPNQTVMEYYLQKMQRMVFLCPDIPKEMRAALIKEITTDKSLLHSGSGLQEIIATAALRLGLGRADSKSLNPKPNQDSSVAKPMLGISYDEVRVDYSKRNSPTEESETCQS